jgi:hypothetical protein
VVNAKLKRQHEKDLNTALEQTFPASDALSDNEVDHRPLRPVHRLPPLIDKKLVDDLAKRVEKKQRTSRKS